MKYKLILIVIILLTVAMVGLIRFMPDRPLKTPATKTLLLIGNILDNFNALTSSEKNQLLATIQLQTNSIEINQAIASFLYERTNNPRSLSDFDMSNGIFQDGWGTPLICSLTNSAIYVHLNPSLKGTSQPFVIWSCGINQTNELGFGDDIFIGN